MGVALGPVLGNIVMRELDRNVVGELIDEIQFYARYVDDTRLLVKPEDINNQPQEQGLWIRMIRFAALVLIWELDQQHHSSIRQFPPKSI